MFCLATNQIAQTGLSSLPPVIYYSEQLFSIASRIQAQCLIGITWFRQQVTRQRPRHQTRILAAIQLAVETIDKVLLGGHYLANIDPQ
ncbi:hypothetical protein E4184_09260 [Aeromonas media]|uniref:Uncharacterized protein n=1 Tax=Aeromonas media TaxID=651 RepID=A0A6M4Y8J7_AERME|nr:hypothetical protein E4184_09260 [Aeromonas media]